MDTLKSIKTRHDAERQTMRARHQAEIQAHTALHADPLALIIETLQNESAGGRQPIPAYRIAALAFHYRVKATTIRTEAERHGMEVRP